MSSPAILSSIEAYRCAFGEKEARDWRKLYLENLEDPVTGRLVYPTFGTFLAEVRKAFRSVDRVQDAMCKLENLRQGKKTAEQVVTEF